MKCVVITKNIPTHWGRGKMIDIITDNIFKCIFLNEDIWILINISLYFVPKGQINNIPALVQIKAWHKPGDKPLSEPIMVILLTHVYVTWPQWAKTRNYKFPQARVWFWSKTGSFTCPGLWEMVSPVQLHVFRLQCQAVGTNRAKCILHLFKILPCSRVDIWSNRLHFTNR